MSTVAQSKAWKLANPEKVRVYKARYGVKHRRSNQDYRLKKRYGISVDQYEEMYDRQKGACAMCQKTSLSLHVDHCHATKRFRGLLCRACNLLLGYAHDNPAILNAGVAYLGRTGGGS